MLLLEFSMSPLGKGESVGDYVARSLQVVEESGLPYQLHALGTILEGEWEPVFAVVKGCFERMREDCERISFTIKGDYRRGRSGRIASKVRSVEERLGRRLRT